MAKKKEIRAKTSLLNHLLSANHSLIPSRLPA